MKTQSLLNKFGIKKGNYTELLIKIGKSKEPKDLGVIAIQEMMIEYGDRPSLLHHMIQVYCANLHIEITLLPLLLEALNKKNNVEKLYTKDQVIKAMDFAHKEGILSGYNSKYKSTLGNYVEWIYKNI